jgi:oligopeptide/dipeptide ABC transporter ATP-binding protein
VTLLELQDVHVDFATADGTVSALDGVTLDVRAGEVLGLVGESGCGKSTLAGAVMGLLPASARVSGAMTFDGDDLTGLGPEARRRLRGDRIAMIVQDPLSALDPACAAGPQIAEAIRAHRKVSRAAARERAIELMTEVGIPGAERRYRDAPHRLSGGMRQRMVVAAALANEPALLIADEPTTALDTTIQAQILALLADLQSRHGMATLLITHDLGVVAQTCDRIGVLYAGQLVELAPAPELFARPRHPYTRALLAAQPRAEGRGSALPALGGRVPDLSDPPAGCRFAPRCPHAMPECATRPLLAGSTPEHGVACWLDDQSRAATAAVAGYERSAV